MSEQRTSKDLLRELFALVKGESPGLLNEDSGGDGALCMRIEECLGAADEPPAGRYYNSGYCDTACGWIVREEGKESWPATFRTAALADRFVAMMNSTEEEPVAADIAESFEVYRRYGLTDDWLLRQIQRRAQPPSALQASLFDGCTIGIEHSHLCVRTETGWLLAARSLKDRVKEWSFDDLLSDALKNLPPHRAAETKEADDDK